MATYNSHEVASLAPMNHALERGSVQVARATVVCAAAPTTGDTLNFFYLPAGARVLGGYLSASDMDTDVSPALALDIGYGGDADVFFAASDVGQAGTAAVEPISTGVDVKFANKTLVTGVAHVDPVTGAPGSVTLALLYSVDL